MSDGKATQLALIYQAIDEVFQERAEALADFKKRITTLQNEASYLRHEILSGQKTIADAIRENLGSMEQELNRTAPPGTSVKLSITEDEELQPAGD